MPTLNLLSFILLLLLNAYRAYAAVDILTPMNKTNNITSINNLANLTQQNTTTMISWQAKSSLSRDEYVVNNQKRCLETQSLVPCIKYKVAKLIWMLATNGMGFFSNELRRDFREDTRRIRFIQLGEPSNQFVFDNAKSLQDDSELTKIVKFLKRAIETFGRNHGIEISLPNSSGARISTVDEVDTPRGRLHEKKKRKWLIILPLIILMKIAHLKMTMVTLFLAVLGLNVLLVGGVGWLIHYLKFKTLCKIHPHLVQSHSHVYDSDPSEYSAFVGSSFPGSYYSGTGSSPHEIGYNGYSKDWASNKAYNGHNYLDTISKRIAAT